MKLTKEQTESVGRAYEVMMEFREVVEGEGFKPIAMINSEGSLFLWAEGALGFSALDDVKDKSIKDISEFSAGRIVAFYAECDRIKAARIKELKDELNKLEA